MLATFRHDADGMLVGVHEAIAEGNLAAAAREAHRLAGGAGAVGAGRFRTTCKELEYHASEGHTAEAQALDRRLDELLDQTWEALARSSPLSSARRRFPPTARRQADRHRA